MLLNAEQAMPSGGALSISTNLPPRSNFIEISFQDTGCGISRQNINKLFDPFFTTKHGGTGLGLAIVKEIVEYHHGRVEVESEGVPGKGATSGSSHGGYWFP